MGFDRGEDNNIAVLTPAQRDTVRETRILEDLRAQVEDTSKRLGAYKEAIDRVSNEYHEIVNTAFVGKLRLNKEIAELEERRRLIAEDSAKEAKALADQILALETEAKTKQHDFTTKEAALEALGSTISNREDACSRSERELSQAQARFKQDQEAWTKQQASLEAELNDLIAQARLHHEQSVKALEASLEAKDRQDQLTAEAVTDRATLAGALARVIAEDEAQGRLRKRLDEDLFKNNEDKAYLADWSRRLTEEGSRLTALRKSLDIRDAQLRQREGIVRDLEKNVK